MANMWHVASIRDRWELGCCSVTLATSSTNVTAVSQCSTIPSDVGRGRANSLLYPWSRRAGTQQNRLCGEMEKLKGIPGPIDAFPPLAVRCKNVLGAGNGWVFGRLLVAHSFCLFLRLDKCKSQPKAFSHLAKHCRSKCSSQT